MYSLTPHNGRKSFYDKAKVFTIGTTKYLLSYTTVVASIDRAGAIHRHWAPKNDKPTCTTMAHIKSFIGEEINDARGDEFNAKMYMALPLEPAPAI